MQAASRMIPDAAPAKLPQLGFGCASLGSRVAAKDGLKALARAYDEGVRWFDVAPPYGAGRAEALLGQFLVGRRDASVTTKVGLAPPNAQGAMRLAYALGRPLARATSGLRRAFRGVGATRNRHVPLTAELIGSSIRRSLKELRRDAVDVYALHDPAPGDLARDEVLRAMERTLTQGLARRIAVAGSPEACLAAARSGGRFSLLQMGVDSYRGVRGLFDLGARDIALHGVYGVAARRQRLLAALRARPDAARRLADAGYDGPPERALERAMLDAAFDLAGGGIVLASMFAAGHVEGNVERWRAGRFSGAAALIDGIDRVR